MMKIEQISKSFALNSYSGAVGIIADDFTSAADAAGPFVDRGLSAMVCRDKIMFADADVLSFDSGSRLLSEQEAVYAMEKSIPKLLSSQVLYKTIDSTLRGNIASELKVAIHIALSSGDYDRVVVAPAFPAASRITRRGVQFVNGVPVAQSSYGLDPVHPAVTSSISDLIDPCFGVVAIIPVTANAKDFLLSMPQQRIFILDTDSQEILNQQVAAISNPERVLWIGSPGMAQALAGLFDIKAQSTSTSTSNIGTGCKRVLIMVGSANPVSRDQCGELLNRGVPVLECPETVPEKMPDEIPVLIPGKAPIVCLSAPSKRSDNPMAVRETLITQATTAMKSGNFDAVIATGGETMVAFMEALGINQLSLRGELEPGFPFGQALSTEENKPLVLAMKAGGFGAPDMLFEAARKLLLPVNFEKKIPRIYPQH